MPTPQPAPGWYPDPGGSEGERYWDGWRWTTQHRTTPSRNDPKPAPPDWYDDPDGSGGERYWDGGRWTKHRRPKAEATVNPPGSRPTWHPTARPSQPQPDRRIWEPSAPRVHQGTVIADGGVEVASAGQAAAASRVEAGRASTLGSTPISATSSCAVCSARSFPLCRQPLIRTPSARALVATRCTAPDRRP